MPPIRSEVMYTTHIHKKESVVNEITCNRECCQQKHDTSYSAVQQYKWLPVMCINISEYVRRTVNITKQQLVYIETTNKKIWSVEIYVVYI